MKMTNSNRFLIILFILGTLLLSVSFVCAEKSTKITTSGNESLKTVSTKSVSVSKAPTATETNSKAIVKPKKVSQAAVISGAKRVKTYADKNKKLPDYVTLSGFKYSMPEFLYVMSKTIDNKYNKKSSSIATKFNIENPSKPSGTWVKGNIYSVYYYDYAKKVIKYSDKNKKAPNTITTAGGNKLKYQTTVYLFAKALVNTKTKLPYYVYINIKAGNPINQYEPFYSRNVAKPITRLLGNDSRGYVQIIGPYGNVNSKVKIAYVIGQHTLENNSHRALYKTITTNKNLKYLYYIYKVTVTKNPYDYNIGRMNGQLLAQKYVLPHIKSNKYNLVIDVHSNQGTKNGGGYEKTNFIFAPLNSEKSKIVAEKIISEIPELCYYFPASQTSPPYLTNPLVNAGIKTLVYETYLYESSITTLDLIKKLVEKVDALVF